MMMAHRSARSARGALGLGASAQAGLRGALIALREMALSSFKHDPPRPGPWEIEGVKVPLGFRALCSHSLFGDAVVTGSCTEQTR